MNPSALLTLLAALAPIAASGQQLAAADRKIVEQARARYYNLQAAGFQSMNCDVKFDLATVPLLPPSADDPVRKLVQATVFTLTVDSMGRPDVQHFFPAGVDAALQQRANQVINLMTALVGGLFQTWPSKALLGPIPPFDAQIESVTASASGYSVSLRVPGAPAHVLLDGDLLVTAIDSIGGKILEHPTYTPGPQGLVFTGNDAVDRSNTGSATEVRYTLTLATVYGLELPHLIHLRVNHNIDTTYSLEACKVTKATVLKLAPPEP